jgi:hypothetical protein
MTIQLYPGSRPLTDWTHIVALGLLLLGAAVLLGLYLAMFARGGGVHHRGLRATRLAALCPSRPDGARRLLRDRGSGGRR